MDPALGANLWEGNFRDVTAGATAGYATGLGPVTYPNAWIKLKRETVATNAISFFYSTNGVDWILRGVQGFTTNAYPDKVFVGMVATAHNNTLGTNTVAIFNDFAITSGTPVAQLKIDSIVHAGANVTLTYGAGTLQSCDTVNGTYAYVAGATSPYTTPAAGTMKFYRLRK